jgi:hypothetical protein
MALSPAPRHAAFSPTDHGDLVEPHASARDLALAGAAVASIDGDSTSPRRQRRILPAERTALARQKSQFAVEEATQLHPTVVRPQQLRVGADGRLLPELPGGARRSRADVGEDWQDDERSLPGGARR